MSGFVTLEELRAGVAARCDATFAAHPEWPCRAGCDHCCRNLAREMELCAGEWSEVERGLTALNEDRQREIAARMDAAAGAPHVCPFLNLDSGQCSIYAHRPLACRTYGFYAGRDGGRYCGMIRERVEAGQWQDVVWGNHDAVVAQYQSGGPMLELQEWRKLTGLIFFKRS